MISDRLSLLKQQLEVSRKPFPLWALLALYETASRQLYVNYFSDFKLLADWLGPIEMPEVSSDIPKLFHTYEIQEIAKHLGTTQGQIYHGYKTTISKLQQSAYSPQLSSQVRTVSLEQKSE